VFSPGPILHRFIFWIRHNEGVRLDGSHFSLGVAAKTHWTAMLTNLGAIFPSVCFVSERRVS
jgi:hypothetical protein